MSKMQEAGGRAWRGFCKRAVPAGKIIGVILLILSGLGYVAWNEYLDDQCMNETGDPAECDPFYSDRPPGN